MTGIGLAGETNNTERKSSIRCGVDNLMKSESDSNEQKKDSEDWEQA